MQARRYWPAVVAGVAASAVFVVSGIIRGTYPFGDRTRSTNYLGQQFIPMAAHLRDVGTGQAAGDLVFNWQSGFGVPFLGDFMAYVGSTLSWIAFVLPRDRIDLALFLIATVAIGIGAGAMTAYLRMIRPSGPVWIAVTAGASYGACSWSIDDAAYMTIWLSGMVAFPVLCLLCEWILQKRSITAMVVTPIVVALLWTSHFYTVYMATIGAGIITLARILAADSAEPWRQRLVGGLRCVLAVALGIGLAAPLLVPTFALVKAATPSPPQAFQRTGTREFLSRLLAGSEGVGTSPSFAVGTLMLLLALSFPFNRAIAVRQRLVWTLTVVLTVVSMQVTFTHRAWHGFDTPQGSSYRQAFVIAGMLVILGWMSVSVFPRSRSLVIAVAPAVLVLGLYLWTREVRHITPTTRIAVPVLIGVALLAWVFTRSPGRLRQGAVAVLVGAALIEVTASSVAIDAARYDRLSNAPYWGAEHEQVRSLVQSMDDWPRYRTAPGQLLTFNDPMLAGGQGPQYYSSTIPHATSRAMIALGFGYTSYGRALYDPENPVVDAVFAIRGRVVRGPKLVTQDAVAPLVTIRPGTPWKSSDPGPYGVQETALGADVYTVPKLSPVMIATGATASVVATCQPGSEVYLTAPEYVDLLIDGEWTSTLRDKRPGIYSSAPLTRVGTADANGNVRVDVKAHQQTRIPSGALACLDRARLVTAVRELTESAPAVVKVSGHSIRIQRLPGRAATVTVAVINIKGWRCAVDGRSTTPIDHAGLLSIAVGPQASEVACTYRPPGTRLGLTVGAGSLATLLLLTALLTLRRRRTRPDPRPLSVQSPGA